ncbi:MAG: flippase-like domain-containing protein [Chloroflexaceae bacterium]|jgi:uncharacterized protein (TIRG00374 family)|nr:flippase-like domain-containing protein [Chloroflexaceae bacterium]
MQQRRWHLLISICISLGIVILAIINRETLIKDFGLLRETRPLWLLAALVVILLSYLISSQVLHIVLRSLGHHVEWWRLWASALVAITISQSVPAGGVGSYAFLVSFFNRRGVSAGQSALVASLETISYVITMLLFFFLGLTYLAFRQVTAGLASYIAGLVAGAIITSAVFILTRDEQTLNRWALWLKNVTARLLRRNWSDERVLNLVQELVRGRELIASRGRDMAWLVLTQFIALSGHSLAMLFVLYALGASVSFLVVMTAFGIALVTSSFNILPGGGGTVEAALIAVLTQFGAGAAATPAAIIFRLLNFWLLAPVAAACYHWLMHEPAIPVERVERAQQSNA